MTDRMDPRLHGTSSHEGEALFFPDTAMTALVPADDPPAEDLPATPAAPTGELPAASGGEAPGGDTPGGETPGDKMPGEEVPGEEAPGEETPGEEVPGKEAPGEETPGEEAPGGETPAEAEAPAVETGQAAVSAGTEVPDERGSLTQWLREPRIGGISRGGWAGLGLLAGLLAAGAAAAVSTWLRRQKQAKPVPAPAESGPWNGRVTVEKLHEQGARPGQQDCFFVSPAEESAGLLAVVADGMGGLADGDKVSQAAVSAMAQAFYLARGTPQQVLIQLAARANGAVNRLLGEDGLYRSGSTLAAGLIREGAFHCLSVGDSRICLLRQGVLCQLNREHVYRNDLYLDYINGEETLEGAAGHPKGAGLSSFLGMGRLKYVDLPAEPVTVLPGDRFVLMSDGVYNALTPQELTAALSQPAGQAARALGSAIQAKGYQNQDNYTAVILHC